ncbi:hypothetical protein ACTXT7_016444, partial [Hymenolepis weldensis]
YKLPINNLCLLNNRRASAPIEGGIACILRVEKRRSNYFDFHRLNLSSPLPTHFLSAISTHLPIDPPHSSGFYGLFFKEGYRKVRAFLEPYSGSTIESNKTDKTSVGSGKNSDFISCSCRPK